MISHFNGAVIILFITKEKYIYKIEPHCVKKVIHLIVEVIRLMC